MQFYVNGFYGIMQHKKQGKLLEVYPFSTQKMRISFSLLLKLKVKLLMYSWGSDMPVPINNEWLLKITPIVPLNKRYF